ncbi:hypothetical protein [Chitinolyticbacter meiyuanensis]|uniref:hypothetical protein n=1 Tax=Chitinolyticbacter meiyuanensis TaxID=682798 RepID=UPI0011E5B651|nr:hypothetical protein [Chitinolyticbacter meiyuanensis]
MSIDYAAIRDQAVVNALLDAGLTLTLRHEVTGDYDPDTGSAPTTQTDYQLLGVVLNYSPKDSGTGTNPNTLIEAGDHKVLIEATGPVPAPTEWSVQIDGEWWRVLNVKTLAPAGVAVLHELHVRR